ncbi:hypothetical protein [Shigella boydii]|uniref:hypothetical protein n=1 Tax=Shigella boydii TaxID=621 RepID=UPI001E2F341C
MIQSFLKQVSTKPELIILVLMVMIIAMLIIPLPTYLVDFLIGLNIVLAILVLWDHFILKDIEFFYIPFGFVDNDIISSRFNQ